MISRIAAIFASVVDKSAMNVVISKSDGSGFTGTTTVSPGDNLLFYLEKY